MNELPNPLQAALRSFCPPPTDADRIQWLEAECKRLRQRLDDDMRPDVLREPLEYQVQVADAVTDHEPDFCSEAEYETRIAHDDKVLEAVNWIVDRHWREFMAKVEELGKKV